MRMQFGQRISNELLLGVHPGQFPGARNDQGEREIIERKDRPWNTPAFGNFFERLREPQIGMNGMDEGRVNRKTGKKQTVYTAPVWTGHADFCNPFEFATFMRTAADLEFDVMLESKAKDLALVRLRPDLLRYAPDVAALFGLQPEKADLLEAEESALLQMENGNAAGE